MPTATTTTKTTTTKTLGKDGCDADDEKDTEEERYNERDEGPSEAMDNDGTRYDEGHRRQRRGWEPWSKARARQGKILALASWIWDRLKMRRMMQRLLWTKGKL